MGIRLKILLAFVVCFGLMAGVSLTLLQRNMSASYEVIESRDLTSHMQRVQQVIEARLEDLSTLTNDWTEWTGMYDYAVKPTQEWAEENAGDLAMAPADLSLLIVYDKRGRVITTTTRDSRGSALALSSWESSPVVALFKAPTSNRRCGLMTTDAGLMLVCWASIRRSDSSGDFVGNVVLGRLMDEPLIKKLGTRINLPFVLHKAQDMPNGLTPWNIGPPLESAFSTGKFFTQHGSNLFHLYYPLQDLVGKPAGLITFDVSREVHQQGEYLFAKVRQEQLLIAAALAALMFGVVHVLLVHRLRRFEKQLNNLADKGTWDTRIDIGGRDELGGVADGVNNLLALIETQVGELSVQSRTDPLTGLANRRAFDAALQQEMTRRLRRGKPMSILTIDVDHFKLYNDHYGHPMGDQALKDLSQVMVSVVRAQIDLVARIGGEEFAILLPDTDEEGAMQTAERLRARLNSAAIAHDASPVASHLTLSIGVAASMGEPVDILLSRVDRAMYLSKENGRNRVTCAQ